jgi:hypothetical protein
MTKLEVCFKSLNKFFIYDQVVSPYDIAVYLGFGRQKAALRVNEGIG